MQPVQEVEKAGQELQVFVENGAGLERRLRVRVPAQRIEHEVENRLRSAARSASIKGYRPGKVPDKVIRQRFGDQIRREVLEEVVQSTYNEAVNREQLRPAGEAQIDTVKAKDDEGQDFIYTAVFEVFPEFTLQGVELLSVNRPDPAFDAADVEFVADNLRRQRGHWQTVDRESRTGDRVIVDFQGRLKDGPMEGGSGEKVTVLLGAGRMLEDFEVQLVGVKGGDNLEIKVRFPPDYQNITLAGQTADFTIQVGEVSEEQLAEIDEEFIRSFGVESGSREDFEQDIRNNMVDEFTSRSKFELKRQLLDQLVKANPIDLPVVLVEQEATALHAEAVRKMGATDPGTAPSLESFRQNAERRVCLGLLIGALIRDQELVVDRGKVRDRVEQLSNGYEKPEDIRKLYYQTPHLISQVENFVLEEQAVDYLASRASITSQPTTFRSLVAV